MTAAMHYDSKPTIADHNTLSLTDHVRAVLNEYYKNISKENIEPKNLYEIVMTEVELPLIEATMKFLDNNQSEASKVLGINRGTFRKKLAHYGMI
jgi:Fis family transcriptional regulator, factor for inversion stimulation protein